MANHHMVHILKRLPKAKFYTNMSKITVVVPVYKTENTLKRCLDSILNQGFSDFEVLLINDGSPDNSEKVCLEYASLDKRIKYIKKENGGLSTVRNLSIEKASGEYICFVDSDDYIDNGCFKFLIDKITETKADIVMCSYYLETNGKSTPIPIENCLLSSENYNVYLPDLKEKNVIDTACNKLYNLEFLRKSGVKCPVNELYEDTAFNLSLLKHNPKIAVYNKCFYHYVLHFGSITRRYNPQKLQILKQRALLLKSVTNGMDAFCDYNYVRYVFSAFIDMFFSLKQKEIFKNIKLEISDSEFKKAAKNAKYKGKAAAVITFFARTNCASLIYVFSLLSFILKYKMQKLFLKVKGV